MAKLNGIIIDGELYVMKERWSSKCYECDLYKQCRKSIYAAPCEMKYYSEGELAKERVQFKYRGKIERIQVKKK